MFVRNNKDNDDILNNNNNDDINDNMEQFKQFESYATPTNIIVDKGDII